MNDLVASFTIRRTRVEVVAGDITQQDTEAIVNAANATLLGGGGVDGAIFAAAGYEQLIAETRKLGGCAVGDAKITKGCQLKARWIIHAVGPRYRDHHAAELLASAYRRSLEIAVQNNISSIAFPAISTGSFGYPLYDAAQVALGAVCDFVAATDHFRLVRFVLYHADAVVAFTTVLEELVRERNDIRDYSRSADATRREP